MSRPLRISMLALLFAALLVPIAGFAQTTINTGALIGVVKDSTGAPLPGVTVTVTGTRLQGSRTDITNAEGEYTIPLLPPGSYRAEYSLSGIKTQVRDKIAVSAASSNKVDVTMQLAVSETVTVTASQVVIDPTQTQQQTNMKEDHLKFTSVSSANRSYQNAIGQVPEAVGTGNVNLAGSNTSMNTFMIDGINALTDPVTHTFASNMVFDAIQEMSVQAFGKDAEYRSSGATINVITKSGGNNFSGSFDYRYYDPNFFTSTGRRYEAAPAYYGGPPNGSPALKFDKSTVTDKSKQPQATLGGPLMVDKLWFFASAHKPQTSRIAANAFGFQPGSRDFGGWNTLAKLTFTPLANHTIALRHSNSYATITNISFSSSVPVIADALQTQHNKNLSLSYDGVLSSNWLVNGQAGHTPASLAVAPMNGDISKVGYSDLDTGVTGGSYTNAQGRTSYRDEYLLSTTYYMQRWGTHSFKVGAYIDRNGFKSYNYRTGDLSNLPGLPADACAVSANTTAPLTCGVSYTVRGGVPVTATISVRNPVLPADARGKSFYAQDQWSPITALTIRAGLRWDGVDWQSSKPVPSFKLLQPRVGVAYDLRSNGATVIHAFGGKLMDENQVTLPNNLNVRYANTATWTYNPTTQKFVFTRSTIAAGGLAVDPNLKAPYSNEYSFGFTQRLWKNTSLDITAEKRTAHNLFGIYSGIASPYTPLPTGLFTACPHDECGLFRSEYRGIVTKIESRPTSNADVTVSWTHAKAQGSTSNDSGAGQNVSGAFNWYPFNFTNYYGYTPDDVRDRVKINGFYRFPWQITVGGSWYWDNGTAWTPFMSNAAGFGTQYLEARGSERFPNYYQLDLQIQKDFTIGPLKAGAIVSILNVLNTEIGTGINNNAGSRAIQDPATGKLYIDPNQQTGANRLSASYGRFTSFQRPRRYEAGLRFEF